MFDFPASPSEGQVFQPAGGPSYRYTGGTWVVAAPLASHAFIGDAPPPAPVPGQLWWESDTGRLYVWVNDGNSQQWVQISGPPTGLGGTADSQNIIVNSNFAVSQEWTPNTAYSTVSIYASDQWMVSYSGPTAATHVGYISYTPAGNGTPYGQFRLAGAGTAYASVAAGNYYGFVQYIEGLIALALGWGTSYAVPAMLSFEVYVSVAGTYGVALQSGNSDRSIAFPITISAGEVNTWKRFTFSVPAITDGSFVKDHTRGLILWFTAMCGTTYQAPTPGIWGSPAGGWLGVTGMSNLLATTNQTFNVRKVGLYADPNSTGIAPPYVIPDHATELQRCERYYQKANDTSGVFATMGFDATARSFYGQVWFSCTMRILPTVALSGLTYGNASGGVVNGSPGIRGFRLSAATVSSGSAYCMFSYAASARM